MLRIEDTDRERSTPENVQLIFDSLEWLGIDWDEGPIYQSDNAAAPRRGRPAAARLRPGVPLHRGPGRGQGVQGGQRQPRLPRRGRGRGRRPAAHARRGRDVVRDMIRGETAFENALQDDLVIARADGTPIYHLAVVVDDHDAGITHVVRGADHYSNTPKHLRIYEALGAEPPVYAHLPLLHGPDGKKLSKRHGAASVSDLRKTGYLREAVINYLACWAGATTRRRRSSPSRSCRSSSRWSACPRTRPSSTSRSCAGSMAAMCASVRRGPDGAARGVHGPQRALATPWRSRRRRSRRSTEFWPLAGSFFDGPIDDPAAREKFLAPPESREALADARAALAALPEPWTDAASKRRCAAS